MRTDDNAAWLRSNGWSAIQHGSDWFWRHDDLRDGDGFLLTPAEAVAMQRKWDEDADR